MSEYIPNQLPRYPNKAERDPNIHQKLPPEQATYVKLPPEQATYVKLPPEQLTTEQLTTASVVSSVATPVAIPQNTVATEDTTEAVDAMAYKTDPPSYTVAKKSEDLSNFAIFLLMILGCLAILAIIAFVVFEFWMMGMSSPIHGYIEDGVIDSEELIYIQKYKWSMDYMFVYTCIIIICFACFCLYIIRNIYNDKSSKSSVPITIILCICFCASIIFSVFTQVNAVRLYFSITDGIISSEEKALLYENNNYVWTWKVLYWFRIIIISAILVGVFARTRFYYIAM